MPAARASAIAVLASGRAGSTIPTSASKVVLAILIIVFTQDGTASRFLALIVLGAALLILVGLTPLVLATRLVRNPEVNGQSLVGAACVYLLMGLFFALIYSITAFVTGSQFFASLTQPSLADYIYFSYITIATVGYGDLAPITTLGRMLAVTEAMTGQLYLVTVVALLVSTYRGQRSRHDN